MSLPSPDCPYCNDLLTAAVRNKLLFGDTMLRVTIALKVENIHSDFDKHGHSKQVAITATFLARDPTTNEQITLDQIAGVVSIGQDVLYMDGDLFTTVRTAITAADTPVKRGVGR